MLDNREKKFEDWKSVRGFMHPDEPLKPWYDAGHFTAGENIYTTSWDALMPVVHKCLVICRVKMLDKWENIFSDTLMTVDIGEMYKLVTVFVGFVNEKYGPGQVKEMIERHAPGLST